jgi:hypothetical protein
MTEWWTYRPSDLLMFAPATYWRLFELHNEALWPLQPVLLVLFAVDVAALWRHGAPSRIARALLFTATAAAWAAVGWGFLLQRYAEINWAAQAAALAFGVQALGLLVLALWSLAAGDTTPPTPVATRRRTTGLVLLAGALLLHPLLAPLQGRPWAQAELAGLAPDPTAIATLGLLLCIELPSRGLRRLRAGLLVLPGLWCLASTATLWTMGAAQALVPAAALVLAVVLAGVAARGAVAHSGSTTSPHGDNG